MQLQIPRLVSHPTGHMPEPANEVLTPVGSLSLAQQSRGCSPGSPRLITCVNRAASSSSTAMAGMQTSPVQRAGLFPEKTGGSRRITPAVGLSFPDFSQKYAEPGTRVSAVHSLSEDRQLIGCFFSEPLRFLPDGKHRAKLLFLLQTGVEFPGRGGCVQTPRSCTRAWFSVPPRSVCPWAHEADTLPSPGLHGTARHLCHSSGLRHRSCFALLALRQDQGPRKPGKDPPSCGHRGKIPERKGSRWEGQALGRERGPGAGEGRLHGGTLWGILAWAAPGRAGSPSPFWFFPRKHPRAGHQAPAAAWYGDRLGFFSPPGIRSNPNFLPPDEKQHSPCADAPHAFSPSSFPTRADSEPFPSRRF